MLGSRDIDIIQALLHFTSDIALHVIIEISLAGLYPSLLRQESLNSIFPGLLHIEQALENCCHLKLDDYEAQSAKCSNE